MTCPRRFANCLWVPAAITLATGCAKPFNEQIDLVGTTPLPGLIPAGENTELTGQPSLLHGLDRRGWDVVTVEVPSLQVVHYPTYAKNFRWVNDRGPWNPAYPTVDVSIVDPTDPDQDLADAVIAPVHAFGMLLWAPIDMLIGNWPWTGRRSPGEPYAVVSPQPPADLWDWFIAADGPADIQWNPPPDS